MWLEGRGVVLRGEREGGGGVGWGGGGANAGTV